MGFKLQKVISRSTSGGEWKTSKNGLFIVMILPVVGYFSRSSVVGLSFVFLLQAAHAADSARSVGSTTPASSTPIMIVGFVGGFVHRDDAVRSEVQLAVHLRQQYPAGVFVEVLDNHHRRKAREDIRRFADADRDGTVSEEEKRKVRIILYGHSWGGSEAVTLARELGREGLPVLLTVQVDSVVKAGENDTIIPENVVQAVNFYQPDGFIHGRSQIRAADPSRTQVIGNFRFDYKASPVKCRNYPWYDRVFMKTHTEIECDPKVWSQVEALIQSKLSLMPPF